MKMGSWDIAVEIGKMPQKVASAFSAVSESLVGAEYEAIAYLGSQVVNGVNHAVLAKQVIVTGRDSENIVVLIFNEKGDDVTLVSIERVLAGGAKLGGVNLNVETDIPEDVEEMFFDAFEGYVGAAVTPFALLGTQVTKGTDYIFAATLSTVALESEEKALIVTINPMTKKVSMADLLVNKHEASLGYAFTW